MINENLNYAALVREYVLQISTISVKSYMERFEIIYPKFS